MSAINVTSRIYPEGSVGVLIGRFQPYHCGHQHLLHTALRQGLKRLIIVIGSSGGPRTVKNPFTAEERERMIREDLIGADCPDSGVRLQFIRLEDYTYNDNIWVANLLSALTSRIQKGARPVLLGYTKDDSSYYLNLFPGFIDGTIEDPYMVLRDQHGHEVLNATNIRTWLFSPRETTRIECVLPSSTTAVVNEFIKIHRTSLLEEFQYYASYKPGKYPIIMTTVDAVVTQDGHILLVKRKNLPGKGLWALPGGFLNPYETLLDGVVRELREETGLKISANVLKTKARDSRVFDSPGRSLRGRVITHCYHIPLQNMDGKLPAIKGGSDACEAKWFPFHEIRNMRDVFYEDHRSIINAMLGI